MENPNKNCKTSGSVALDRELDAALAKYAAAEPRPGMEDRILANLRVVSEHVPNRWWWTWRRGLGSIAVAAVVLLVVGLAWRSGTRPAQPIAQRPTTQPDVRLAAPQTTSRQYPAPVTATKPVVRRSHTAATAAPKLEQFPSPRPLSEQERILAGYVAADPDRAVLLARARLEALRRDQIEEMQPYPRDAWATDSEDRNSDTSEK